MIELVGGRHDGDWVEYRGPWLMVPRVPTLVPQRFPDSGAQSGLEWDEYVARHSFERRTLVYVLRSLVEHAA